MNHNLHKVIGIDLGTTYSAVAAWNNQTEQSEIVFDPADGDKKTTPSVISLDRLTQKAIVGWAAKENLPTDPFNTIIEIKREMGTEFTQESLRRFGAEGKEKNAVGTPVKASFGNEWLLPQELSAFTLMRMKEIAEKEIGPIRDAVITVPAWFTAKQKKATEEAALLAGLYPHQLIPEPTAAAICYGVDQFTDKTQTYLVYDLGGGTFDVSIIRVEPGGLSVIATDGDPRLGGSDFDDAITDWAIDELFRTRKLDVKGDKRACARIKARAERTKIALSSAPEAILDLTELDPANPPLLTLTQKKFEDLIDLRLKQSLNSVNEAIKKAGARDVKREDINAILLVGGSTKIPATRRLLLGYFGKDDDFVRRGLNPDEVVARGAAIIARKYQPSPAPFRVANQKTIKAEDMDDIIGGVGLITEHSLGVGVLGTEKGDYNRIINQGEGIPTSRTRGGYANTGPCSDLEVQIYQGEGDWTRNCSRIGQIHLGPMEPKPEGYHKFEATFSINESGLLSVTVHHINEGRQYQAQFDYNISVGGIETLQVRHEKLKTLYGGSVLQTPVGPATIVTDVRPPIAPTANARGVDQGRPNSNSVSNPNPGIESVRPNTTQPAAGQNATAETPASSGDGTPFRQPVTQTVYPVQASMETQAPAPAPRAANVEQPAASLPQAPAAMGGLYPLYQPIPPMFQFIVNRSVARWQHTQDQALLQSLNALYDAVNRGLTESTLEALATKVDDAFQKTRT